MKLGERLGPYEIVGVAGSGGMGEVYRARDTRLDRTVAIKILPAELARDERFRARFEHEAKSISALSHPHICAIHDVGRENGIDYLVMEYCEGKTLAERIAEGPLPIERVVEYGMQIADALDNAHRAGIVHRDLKPANAAVTRAGIKLLDFGLAKRLVESSPDAATAALVTAEGTVPGTVQYMAPELFEGKEADARSDVFALGLMLYEMASGHPAFVGTTKASLIAAILGQEPAPVADLRPEIAAALDGVIRVCLSKDPAERMQSAHDVKLLLQAARGASGTGTSISVLRRGWRGGIVWSAATAAVFVAVLFIARDWRTRRPAPAPPTIRHYSILLPPDASMTGASSGASEDFDLSPDGTTIVYRPLQHSSLFLRRLDSPEVKRIEGTRGSSSPLFSPDGRWIAFASGGELKKVPIAGGTPLPICPAGRVRGMAWRADGTIVFGTVEGLQIVDAAGGVPRSLTRPGRERHLWPAFLPDGRHLLFTIMTESGDPTEVRIAVVSLETGQWRTILQGASRPRYVDSGRMLYVQAGVLFATPFDLRRLAVTGKPVPIADDVHIRPVGGAAWYRVAADGTVVYLPRARAAEEVELLWVDRNGSSAPLSASRRSYTNPRLSPDGKRLLVTARHDRGSDIWLCDIERDSWSRLTSRGSNDAGVWSPDGKQIGFSSSRSGTLELYVAPADQSLPPRQVTRREVWSVATSWSPDGRTIALYEQPKATISDVNALSPADGSVTPIAATPFIERFGTFSPDGRWIAYQSNESGRLEVYVQRFPGPGPRYVIGAGEAPRWPSPGGEIVYLLGSKMMAVDVRAGESFTAGKPHLLFEADFGQNDPDEWPYDVTAAGRRFVVLKKAAPAQYTQLNVIVGALPVK